MADLGDLGAFLKEGNIANLDWLEVDEKKYREEDVLPKQNLDVAPDLLALWDREDKPTTNYLVPNKQEVKPFEGAGDVHTMGDMSQAHGRLRVGPEDIAKVTRYAMMQSTDMTQVRRQLTARFDLDTLRAYRPVIAGVIAERGLLGRIYVAATDFPNCTNSSKTETAFVRKFASDAKYIVAKSQCGDCIHAKKIGSKTNCSVFHKEIVLDVPYTEQLAANVEKLQQTRGKVLQASTGLTTKERVRLACLAQDHTQPANVYRGVGEDQLPKPAIMPVQVSGERLIQASSLTRKRDAAAAVALAAKPVVAFVRRELLKGRTASELVESLKVSFPMNILTETRSAWEPHFREAGIYGAIYSTQDSFDECREGADFLAKHNPGIRAMVAGEKCTSCIYNKISRCMLYGKPLVKDAASLSTWETVDTVVLEHKNAGRLPAWEKTATLEANTPREALKTIHNRVNAGKGLPNTGVAGRMDIFHAWAGNRQEHVASGSVKRDIVKVASKYMNEGLYGVDLLRALKARFEIRDLTGAREELKVALREQGLQGIYYVDASTYDDYGHGCEEVSRLFRAKQVPYAKLGSKCESCVHNNNRHCGKLNKPLVVEPPYVDKSAQQRAILASGSSMDISAPSLMAPSGLTMMTEYQLQNGGMDIELNEVHATESFDITLGRTKVKL